LNPLPIRLEIPRQGLSNANLKQRSFDRDLQGDDFMIKEFKSEEIGSGFTIPRVSVMGVNQRFKLVYWL